jgi:hypothetical protein
MRADLLKDITENKFLLILMDENEYVNRLKEILKSVEKTGTKICYVCLSKPYSDIVSYLGANGISDDGFFFIDVLSSHYGAPEPSANCTFISSPANLEDIRKAIIEAVEKTKCSVVVFDTISTLLIYQQTHSIVKFTNSLVSEKKQENTKKLFIMLKDESALLEDMDMLTKDLEMFADKKIDLSRKKDINSPKT